MSKSNSPNSGRARAASSSSRAPARSRSAPRRDEPPRRPRQHGTTTNSSHAATFRARHPVLTTLVPLGLVLAIVATMVVIKVAQGSSTPASADASHVGAGASSTAPDPGIVALPSNVVAALNVPTSTLDTVGRSSSVVPPSRVGDGSIGRGADGKPLITYVGAEYCPYCAAERWALAVALSRFGTFTNLAGTHSASQDVYPDTQTLSFYGSHYTSAFVDFQSVEQTTNEPVGGSYPALETPTAQERALMATYDSGGSIPFLDIANRFVVTGSSYSPQVLQGLSRDQIAAQLGDPKSAVAQAIDGAANEITAAIASVSTQLPSSVASSPVIASIAKGLGA